MLRDGTLEQIGTPHAVVTRPASAWVASFISDATLLDGTVDGGCVVVGDPELRWKVDEVNVVDHGNGTQLSDGAAVTVAVLPGVVQVVPSNDAATGTHLEAVVTSVLFEVDSYSVNLEAGGVEFRARMAADPKPEVGDTVSLRIDAPLVYPA